MTAEGDYYVVPAAQLIGKSLADLIRGERPRSSTGKVLYGANARRRMQFRRNGITGLNIAVYDWWASQPHTRPKFDIIDADGAGTASSSSEE